MNHQKKSFFQEPNKAHILRVNTVNADDNLVGRIENLNENEALIIEARLIPIQFPYPRKFLKHGEEVKPKRVYTLEDVSKNRFVPVKLREEAFNSIDSRAYCAYSFMPISGNDRRKRKVNLVECVEGARIFAYAHNRGTGIEFEIYDDSKRVKSEGAEIIVRVPSRTVKRQKYEFKLISMPVIDSRNKFAVAQSISSMGHDCKKTLYNFRFKYEDDQESSRILNFCAHEISAYFEIANHYWEILKEITPLQMSEFAIPTMKTVEYYKRLCDSVLIRDEALKVKDKLRKLNKAEKEILLWDIVYKHKHNETFFATEKIEKYNWSLRNTS